MINFKKRYFHKVCDVFSKKALLLKSILLVKNVQKQQKKLKVIYQQSLTKKRPFLVNNIIFVF